MIEEINKFVKDNYQEFVRQSKVKLHFRYCDDKSAHIELVHLILTPFLEKIKNNEQYRNSMFKLLKEEKLFLYLIKSIVINAKFPSAPFLRNKFKFNNHRELTDTIQIAEEEDFFEQLEMEDKLNSMLNKETFDEFFGKYSYLYLEIILQYAKPNSTYKSIADYYGISKSSVAAAIINVKARLKAELQ